MHNASHNQRFCSHKHTIIFCKLWSWFMVSAGAFLQKKLCVWQDLVACSPPEMAAAPHNNVKELIFWLTCCVKCPITEVCCRWPAALDSEMLLLRWRMARAKELRPWISASWNYPASTFRLFICSLEIVIGDLYELWSVAAAAVWQCIL